MTASVLLRPSNRGLIGRLIAFNDYNDEYFHLDKEQKTELGNPFLIINKKGDGNGRQHSFHFGTDESVAVVDLKYIIASKLVLVSELIAQRGLQDWTNVRMDVLELMLKDCRTDVERVPLKFITNLQECKAEESPVTLSKESEYYTTVKLEEGTQALLEQKSIAKFVFLSDEGNVESSLNEETNLKFVQFEPIKNEIDVTQIEI